MSHPALLPQIDDPSTRNGARWKVTIYNNDYTDRTHVLMTIIKATGCDVSEAEIEVWEAEAYGRAAVHFADREECDGVAQIIGQIGVKAEVSLEWEA